MPEKLAASIGYEVMESDAIHDILCVDTGEVFDVEIPGTGSRFEGLLVSSDGILRYGGTGRELRGCEVCKIINMGRVIRRPKEARLTPEEKASASSLAVLLGVMEIYRNAHGEVIAHSPDADYKLNRESFPSVESGQRVEVVR